MVFFGRIHPVPLIAGLVVAVLAVQLGNWQLNRAEQKREIGARIAQLSQSGVALRSSARDAAPPEWSRVRLVGEWLSEAVMFHDNRVHERRPGYHVLMPLRLQDGSAVLVNRGWVPAGLDRARLPDVVTPVGNVDLVGRVIVPERDPFSLGSDPRDGARWQFVDPAGYAEWSGVSVAPWVVQQTSDAADGMVREWPAPALGEATHRGYALQWFSLAALALGLTGFYVFRSFRKHAA